MPVENGEVSGFVKIFYGILITLAVCGGMYMIISGLVVSKPNETSYFEELLRNDLLNPIKLKINTMTNNMTN